MKLITKLIFPLFLFALLAIGPASAQTTLSGSLSNFDVFNDTGHESHGFEIELHGISSKDISYTFGGTTYIRYDDPKTGLPGASQIIDIPGGVVIRYASAYVNGAFTASTPIPAVIATTPGHSCWKGGQPGYLASGCEHFGAGLTSNPTSVQYRWLIEDSTKPGTLIPGADVSIAAPLWTVTPAAAGVPAQVNAAIAPPEKRDPQRLLPDAVWVKVFESESSDQVELKHLLTDDSVVPQDASHQEVEMELSQYDPKKPDGALQHGKSLGKDSNGKDNQSVIRRFEFYKYTGPYGPEGEAACGGSGKGNSCVAVPGVNVGAFIGAQMAAALLGPIVAPKVAITSVSDAASFRTGVVSGSWVSIFGSGLSATTRQWKAADFQGNNLPVALDGVSVTINGKTAAVWFISPGQLNVQAPADIATGPVQVQVTNSSGSATGTATLQQYAPGFFTQGKYAAAVHSDGAYVAPVGSFGGAVASRPAQPGETLLIFGSGFGPTSPAVSPGQIVSVPARMTDPSQLHFRIGGALATVQYAGIVAVGEYQFNVVVPALPDGDQSITADIGGVFTQSGLLIPIKN